MNIYAYNYIHIYIKEPYPQKGSCISAKETYVSVKEPKLFIKEACKSEEENYAMCCPTVVFSIEKFTCKVLMKGKLQFGNLQMDSGLEARGFVHGASVLDAHVYP